MIIIPTKINESYFDIIDTPNKAYWIGFIWSDGSVMTRKSKTRSEYLLKIDLMLKDKEHLEKLNKDMCGEYKVKIYQNYKSSFGNGNGVCRLAIYNKKIALTLIEKYGIFSHRTDSSLLLNSIPVEYKNDFIRGILDADGSFQKYTIKENGYICNKYALQFGASPEILRFIEDYLISMGVINKFKRKLLKRHAERDGNYFKLSLSGRPNVINTLSLLYENSETCLDRKYEKYINMKEGD